MTLGFRLLLLLYSAAVEAAVWTVLVPMTLARIALGRAPAHELRERLGRTPPRRGQILIHAASAGEMNAAEPIVAGVFRDAGPIVLSTQTAAGMVRARRLAAAHPAIVACVFAPWDRRSVSRWLADLDVRAAVVIESEIWPNLFTSCKARGVPLFVANGRLRAADVARYRLAHGFFARVLEGAVWIGAQEAADRTRFVAIGARPDRVEVIGNLKNDVSLETMALPAGLARRLDGRVLIVAGSTHKPEERWLSESMSALRRSGREVRLVIAPRDVRRGLNIVRAGERLGLKAVRWSALRHTPSDSNPSTGEPWDLLVLDEHGWLTAFYAVADIVFLGGTLAPIGGHSLVEPASRGRAIVVGPHVDQIRPLVDAVVSAGGLATVSGADPVAEVTAAFARLIDCPERRTAIGAAARTVSAHEGGASIRMRDAVLPRLAAVQSDATRSQKLAVMPAT